MSLLSLVLLLALQAQAPNAPKPFDCSGPEFRQFDFWIGEWDVIPNSATAPANASPPPADAKPASNVVERGHHGCVLIENWDDRQGGTGQSLNIYDRVSKRWHQTWVDSNGGMHQYWGGLEDGKMVFMGEVPLPSSSRFQGRRTIRLSFIPMGSDTVRQLSESLTVDGTWIVNYDLIYMRRAKAK